MPSRFKRLSRLQASAQRQLVPSHMPGGRRSVLGAACLLLGILIAGSVVWNLKPAAPPLLRPVTRFTITLPPGQQLAGLEDRPAVALSQDGTHLAYVASQGGAQQLYLRAMDGLEATPLPGTEGAVNPFFSPDGQGVGFLADGKLRGVSVLGGAARTIADASVPLGASWGSQGMIAFGPLPISALQQVSDTGGGPQPLTRLEKGEFAHGWPEFLPDGKAVLFVALARSNELKVAVQSLGTGERQNLIPGGARPRYAPSGHLVYTQFSTRSAVPLMAVPFDIQRLTVTGAPVPVIEGVRHSASIAASQYSISATGSLVYVPGGAQAAPRRLVWVDRQGREQALPAPARAYVAPRLSPDGQRVAVTVNDSESTCNIHIYDLARNTLTRLTSKGPNSVVAWMPPDGKRIAFELKHGRDR